MDGWMDGWVGGWVDGWMDAWMPYVRYGSVGACAYECKWKCTDVWMYGRMCC